MKTSPPLNQCRVWRNEQLFNIDFASYTLSRHHFAKHFHDHYVIELVLNGVDDFYCAGKYYSAVSNQLVLINPGEVHTGNTVDNTPLRYFSLCPDKLSLQKTAELSGVSIASDFVFPKTLVNNPVLTGKFLALYLSFQTESSILQRQELLLDCMSAFFLHCSMSGVNALPPKKGDHRINLLVDFICHHYKEEISLQQLASLVNLNPCYMLRLFKKTTGLSPYEYLLVTRTEQAKQLLRRGYKVEEAALETGFYDSSHFNRLFRKIAGASPISYRLSKGQYRTSFTG